MASSYSKFVEVGKKIVAVGRNYKDHAAELGNKVPDTPLLFMKPTSAYITEGNNIKIPRGCVNLQHEVELGIVISKKAIDVSESQAMDYVAGYVLALDMTARDFQEKAKKEGNPWIFAKGFDTSCPISKFIDKNQIPDPHNVNLWCKVNGQMRQNGNTKDMMFKIPFIISYISSFFTLDSCDVILTGTPKGVSGVKPGDKIECGLDKLVVMTYNVESK